MKTARALLLGCGVVALLAVAACQGSESSSTPVAPNDALVSVSDEAKGDGHGIGGVKVDSACSSVCGSDNEDNTIAPSATQYVWIQNGTGVFCTAYRAYLEDKGQSIGSSFVLTYDQTCSDGKTNGYTWTAPAAPGVTSESVTMTVECDDFGYVIGSDSFRLVNNGNCEK